MDVCVCVAGCVCALTDQIVMPLFRPCHACPALWQKKRVNKRVNKKSLFLPNDTQPHNISYFLYLSAPWRLLWLLRVIISGLALALLMLLLAYTITVVCFSSFCLVKGKKEVRTGSGRTSPGTLRRMLDISFNHQSVYVCVFVCVWKCVHVR